MKLNKQNAYYILTVAVLLLMGMVNMGQAVMQTLVLPFIREDLGLSFANASLMLTVRSAFTVIATLVTDKVFNKTSIKFGILFAFVCSVLSAVLYGVAKSYAVCIAAIALSGFAFGLGGTIPAALIVRRWFVKSRGLVLGICAMSSGVTSLILSVPVSRIVSERGVLAAELCMAAIFAIVSLIVMLLLREHPESLGLGAFGADDVGAQVSASGAKHRLPPADKKGVTMLCIAMVFCGFFTYCSWDNFNLSAIAAGYDAVFISSVMALNGLMNMIGKPCYGIVADAIGAPKANLIYYVLLIIGHVVVALFNGVSVVPVYIVVICLGLGSFTISTVGAPVWVAEMSDEKDYAATLKKLQSCCTIGGLCMSPLPGLLADAMGGSYNAYYLFCAVTTTLSLILVNSVYKKQRRLSAAK